MDLLVSLGSTLAFIYSVLSCVQSAATALWCRPLFDAATATAGASSIGSTSERAYHDVIGQAEPQVFFDTCAMLICILLLGKVGPSVHNEDKKFSFLRLNPLAASSCSFAESKITCWWLKALLVLQVLQLKAKAKILTELNT